MEPKNQNATVAWWDNVNLYEQQPTQTQSWNVTDNGIPVAPTFTPVATQTEEWNSVANNLLPSEWEKIPEQEIPKIEPNIPKETQPQNAPEKSSAFLENIKITNDIRNQYTKGTQDLIKIWNELNENSALKSAIETNKELMDAQANLVEYDYIRQLNDKNAEVEANNNYIKLLDDRYTSTSNLHKRLWLEIDTDLKETQTFYKNAVNQRVSDRNQALFNQQQFLAETARLSWYGVGSNAAAYVAWKMLNFTSEYDLRTEEIYKNWVTLSAELRQSRASLENDLNTLASNFWKAKKDAYLEAKKAENAIKYLVDGETNVKKEAINKIKAQAQEKISWLQSRYYKDVEDRLNSIKTAYNNEIAMQTAENELVTSQLNNAMSNGSVFGMSNSDLRLLGDKIGVSPEYIRSQAKMQYVDPIIRKLLSEANITGDEAARISWEVITLMSESGYSLQEALYEVAKKNGIEEEYSVIRENLLNSANWSWDLGSHTKWARAKTEEELKKQIEELKVLYPDINFREPKAVKDKKWNIIEYKAVGIIPKKKEETNEVVDIFWTGWSEGEDSFDAVSTDELTNTPKLVTKTTSILTNVQEQKEEDKEKIKTELENFEIITKEEDTKSHMWANRYSYEPIRTGLMLGSEMENGFMSEFNKLVRTIERESPDVPAVLRISKWIATRVLSKPQELDSNILNKTPENRTDKEKKQFVNYTIEKTAHEMAVEYQKMIKNMTVNDLKYDARDIASDDLKRYPGEFTNAITPTLNEAIEALKMNGGNGLVYDAINNNDYHRLLLMEMFRQLGQGQTLEAYKKELETKNNK